MASEAPIPKELVEYVRNPLAERFTAEIFEDLHFVLDQYIVELATARGATEDPQEIVETWEQEHRQEIKNKQNVVRDQYGALLPYAFISSNLKVDYLRESGHASFESGAFPEDVTEVIQEFLEIVTCREELEG